MRRVAPAAAVTPVVCAGKVSGRLASKIRRVTRSSTTSPLACGEAHGRSLETCGECVHVRSTRGSLRARVSTEAGDRASPRRAPSLRAGVSSDRRCTSPWRPCELASLIDSARGTKRLRTMPENSLGAIRELGMMRRRDRPAPDRTAWQHCGDHPHRGPLAQQVEHRTFNPLVVGSIPTRPTKIQQVALRSHYLPPEASPHLDLNQHMSFLWWLNPTYLFHKRIIYTFHNPLMEQMLSSPPESC